MTDLVSITFNDGKNTILIFVLENDGKPGNKFSLALAKACDCILIKNINDEIKASANKQPVALGIGCLAAQVVKAFKTRAGGANIVAHAHEYGLPQYEYHIEGAYNTKPIITCIRNIIDPSTGNFIRNVECVGDSDEWFFRYSDSNSL